MDLVEAPWTVERFIAWEDRQDGKHEFDGTRIVAMTGGSRRHQRIVFNLLVALTARLDPARFDAVQEMRVRTGPKVRYPDVVVATGPISDTTRTLNDAVVVFEVLSDDTAETDRDDKRRDYAMLPGIRRYVLVEQNDMGALVHTRTGEGWATEAVTAGAIVLPEIGVELALVDIYANLAL